MFISPSSETMFETVVRFFKEDEWKFQQLEEKTILYMKFSGSNGNWECFAKVQEEEQLFIFYSELVNKVPQEKRMAMAEYLTRANYGLRIGNFEMDFGDGEIRYKTSIDVQGGELTTENVKRLVYTNLLTTDRYFPGIMSVIYAGVSPEAAIKELEGY